SSTERERSRPAPSLPALLWINREEVTGYQGLRRRLRCTGGAVRTQQQCNQAGPAGLMRCTQAAAGGAVKILIKQHIVAEPGIFLLDPRIAEHRPVALLVAQKNPAQTPGELGSHFTEVMQPTRPDRTFDLEVVAVITVE